MKIEASKQNRITTATDHKKVRKTILAMVALAVLVYSLVVNRASYPPNEEALDALQSSLQVTVMQTKRFIQFEKVDADNSKKIGYFIYPHDDIDAAAYAPLAREMSLRLNAIVFILKYPFNFTWLAVTQGKTIQKQQSQIDEWHVLMHGNGGMLSNVSLPDHIKTITYASSYPLVQLQTDTHVMVLRGSMDEVHPSDLWQRKYKLFPKQSIFYEIPLGNFSNFASFGVMPTDVAGLLSANEQQQLTLEYMEDFIEGL